MDEEETEDTDGEEFEAEEKKQTTELSAVDQILADMEAAENRILKDMTSLGDDFF